MNDKMFYENISKQMQEDKEKIKQLEKENKQLKQMVNFGGITITNCPNCEKEITVNFCRETENYRQKYLDAVADYETEKYKNQKAIEYIENHCLYQEEYDYDYEKNLYLSSIEDSYAKEDLLEILKGGENNE